MFRLLVKSATLLLRREAQLVLVCVALILWMGVGTAQAGSLIAFPNVNENVQPSLLPGYLAKPDGSGPFPAVVILHGCGVFFPAMRQLLMICNGRAMSRSRLTASDHARFQMLVSAG